MPQVSVILPTRDRAALLPRAVASVLAQSEADFEVVLVDNNSGPGVAEAHEGERWLGDPRVRITRAARARTAAAARNTGLAQANGEFVTYLDDDDVYRPQKLTRQLRRLQQSGSDVALCGACYHLAGGRKREVQTAVETWNGDAVLLHARWGTPFLMHRATRQRFDETLGVAEDLEFGLRLWAASGRAEVPVAGEPLVDVYPQAGIRVNTRVESRRRAIARVLHAHRTRFSLEARRRFLLQTLLAIAKHSRQPGRCAALSWRLLRESGGADWRACANACLTATGLFPGRWVS